MKLFVRESSMKAAGCWALLVCAAGVCSCAHSERIAQFQKSRAAVAESVLVAAREDRINMFGELPPVDGVDYHSRAAISTRQHTFTEEGADFDVDVDRNGGRLVFASTRHNLNPDLYVKSIDGVAVTQLTADPAADIQPMFSPDGQRVAFSSDRSGNWDIWIIDIEGTQPVQVTSGPTEDVHPSWSPDGKRLVYCSLPTNGGQWELWIADTAAGSSKTFIGFGLFPEWSPVDETIVFQRARARGSRSFSIWTITLVDGEPRYPTEIAASAAYAMILPTWSNDGAHIAYATVAPGSVDASEASTPGSVSDIWVVSADGRSRTRLTDGFSANYAPGFSADGRLFFTVNRSRGENVWSLLPVFRTDFKSPGQHLTATPSDIGHDRETMAETIAEPAGISEDK